MYNAVVVVQLTYGLSTVQLSLAILNNMDAFQIRRPRYVRRMTLSLFAHIKSGSYDKLDIISNDGAGINVTWQEFNCASHFDKPRTIKNLVEYSMFQQNKVFGHAISCARDDPMLQCACRRNVRPYVARTQKLDQIIGLQQCFFAPH